MLIPKKAHYSCFELNKCKEFKLSLKNSVPTLKFVCYDRSGA